MGPGRAGGAPARQDVVFHIKGVGALGRAIHVADMHIRITKLLIALINFDVALPTSAHMCLALHQRQ